MAATQEAENHGDDWDAFINSNLYPLTKFTSRSTDLNDILPSNRLWPFTFCGNDRVTITIVSAKFPGLHFRMQSSFKELQTYGAWV